MAHANRSPLFARARALLLALALLTGFMPLSNAYAGTLTVISDAASCLAAGGSYDADPDDLICTIGSYTISAEDTLQTIWDLDNLREVNIANFTNNGTFLVDNRMWIQISNPDTFLNAGTIELNSTLRMREGNPRNTGTININQRGTLDLFPSPSLSNEGTINVRSGGTLYIDDGASLTNSGTITLACGSSFTRYGTYSGTPPENADCTPPSVSVNQAAAQADPTISNPVVFTAQFSEPVNDFTGSDVTLSGTANLAGATATISGGPSVYTISVSGIAGNGTVIASIAAGMATDAAGNGNTASTSNDNSVTFITDSTPPVITPAIAGTAGSNGWYVSNVNLTWSVVEAESSISSKSGCDTQNVASDTAGTTFSCSATSVGGTSNQAVTIKRDATLPTISAAAITASNTNGWYNGAVTVHFTCGDNLSGVASCPADQTLTGEGASVGSTAQSATDAAGNASAPSNVVRVAIDKTAPSVSVTGVSNGASYPLGSVPAAACSTTDALSGVAAQATLSITGGNADGTGSFTATCSGATDKAGNTGAASASYTVAYRWSGFFQPVDNLPTVNSAKAGSAIPIKFSLGGDYGLNIFAQGYPKVQVVSCGSGAPIDEIEQTVTAGGSSLSYDAASGQYTYVWKTDKAWAGSCRQLIVRLVDGTDHVVLFQLR
jgi:hypothetical protein